MSNGDHRYLRSHPSLLKGLLVVGTCLLLGMIVPTTGLSSSGSSPPAAGSGLVPLAVSPPTVFAHQTLVISGSSATSPPFASQAGDTLVVFVSVFGSNTVSVADSTHDTFSQLATNSPPSGKSYNSLVIFAASNVHAATTKTVTATLTGTATYSGAADIVDVTGVAPSPVVSLGRATNYTTASLPADASTSVVASASGLVLAGISAEHTHLWNPVGGDSVVGDARQSASGSALTAAALSVGATASGVVWVNATTTSNTTDWISEAIALPPASVSSYAVTVKESGLSARHAWYATLGGSVNSTKTSSITYYEANGTYPFAVGGISGYVATPASGSVTVAGSARTVTVTFGPDTSDWTTYLGGVARNAANNVDTTLSVGNAMNLTQLWTSYIGHVQTEPMVQDGMLYAGGINGYEYEINASSGATVWKTFIGQVTQPNCDAMPTGITSSATLSGGVVYVGGGNITGNLTNGTAGWYALNETTGAIEWSLPIGPANRGYYNWASPFVADGNAYIGVASRCDEPLVWGGVLQVSLTTHAVTGFFNTTVGGKNKVGASVWGSPTLDQRNNTIFFATGNPLKLDTTTYSEAVVAINATTLAPVGVWQVPATQVVVDSDFGTTPTYFHLPNGTPMVVAVNKNGYLYALNPLNLSAGPVWESLETNTQDPPTVDPASFGGGLLYSGSGGTSINGVNYSGAIRAYYPGNGTLKWFASMPGDVFGAPIYSNGILVVAGGPGLSVFNASNGARLWNWTCKSWFDSAPTVAEGRIYVGCHNLYAFGLTGAPPVAPSGAPVSELGPAVLGPDSSAAAPVAPVSSAYALPERILVSIARRGT